MKRLQATARPGPARAVAAVLWAACALAPQPAWSQAAASASSAAADPSPREVRGWLMRIHDAASRQNFQGTFVVSGGGMVASARIAHFCEGSNEFERSEALDGQARRVYRHNDVVTTVWPERKAALVEERDPIAQFPALLQAGDDRIADFYDVRRLGTDRVAGREADVLDVRARDGHRYGWRLWADRASGLLLRAEVIGERNEVLETSAFSDVSIGVKPHPETVVQPLKKLDGYRIRRPALVPTRLAAEGWEMRQPAPGFREVRCVKRPMDDAAFAADPAASATGSAAAAAPSPVLQSIFSDGLTHVSVFIEPYDPRRHTRALRAAVGPTQTLMQQQGDWWVTVVGDVPPATLRLFAKGLARLPP